MQGLQWIHPIAWTRAFFSFVRDWAVSIRWIQLKAAVPAIVALAFVALGTTLTFIGDSQWRRGLVRNQLAIAQQAGANKEVAVLAKRLLIETPDDLDLRFTAATASAEGDHGPQAKQSIDRLARKHKHGRAAMWLLEKDYSPIAWDQWDVSKRAAFGSLLEIASEAQPNNPGVASIFADYLLVTGATDKAFTEIAKLASTQPPRAMQGALLLRQAGKESQGIAMANEGLALISKTGAEEPENVDAALLTAQFCLFLKKYEDAIRTLNRTAKVSQDPRLRAGMAETLVLWSRDQASIPNETERFAKQLRLLSKAVELAPNHPLVINDLMTVALQCSDETDPKVAQLRDILVQGVAPDLSHFIRGTAAMMQNNVEDATLHLELAAKSFATVPAVLNNLAVALASRAGNDLERALKLVDAALKQVPTEPYFHETRAQILLQMGRYSDAVNSFEKSFPAEALREQIHTGLSKAYRELGQIELAEQHRVMAEKIKNLSENR